MISPLFSLWPERIHGLLARMTSIGQEKMNHCTPQIAGVDISKASLDVVLAPGGVAKVFSNDRKGHCQLMKWLADYTIERIVFEATGAYHRLFERTLDAAGWPMAKVNPRHARRFAEATGKLAKTDRCDAAMLARFGALLQPDVRPACSQTIDDMQELQTARNALVKDRTAAKNRQKNVRSSLVKRQVAQRLRQIESQIKAIDQGLEDLCAADQNLKQRFEILISIPGIGATTAYALLIEMPELGHIGNPQAASLAGRAPIARDSGRWRGKRSIKGGRQNVRHALYMPAQVAARFNPDLIEKYQALTNAGKAKKIAITAVMRKLLILANTLLAKKRKWAKIAP